MDTMTYSYTRQNFANVMDRVNDDPSARKTGGHDVA